MPFILISPLSFISILLVFIICLYFIDDDKKGEKGLFQMCCYFKCVDVSNVLMLIMLISNSYKNCYIDHTQNWLILSLN